MRVSASVTRLVNKLRMHNWPDEQIRCLLSAIPAELVDKLLADTEVSGQ